ncbi:NAD-P-binding protein [Sparassis latifolia]
MGLFSRSFNPDIDLPDLKGKVIAVTGGSSGIGYATVQHLARHGAKVYMAARNEEKSKAAIARLQTEGLAPGNGEIVWLDLELSDPRNAKRAAEQLIAKEQRLDVLINNAAMPRGPYALTSEGIQDVMAINHVSPFVFTNTLLPLLYRTAKEPNSDVRIVNVASDGIMFLKRGVRFRNLGDFNDEHAHDLSPGLSRYFRSKIANVLFTQKLQKRLDADGVPIIAMALNPGTVRTEGLRNDAAHLPPVVSTLFSLLVDVGWATPSKGAYTSVFAAATPAVRAQPDVYKDAYLEPPGKLGSPPNQDAKSPELAEELWNTTVEILSNLGIVI